MNRATAVYIIMGVAGIAGIWVILAIGATLTAPPDLAGKWALLPPGTHVAGALAAQTAAASTPDLADKTPTMWIEQSGQFFQVSFDDGLLLDLRLKPAGSGPAAAGKPAGQAMQLVGGNWTLTLGGITGGDVLDVALAGPRQEHWTALRTVRTFAANPGSTGHGTAGAGERTTSGTRE